MNEEQFKVFNLEKLNPCKVSVSVSKSVLGHLDNNVRLFTCLGQRIEFNEINDNLKGVLGYNVDLTNELNILLRNTNANLIWYDIDDLYPQDDFRFVIKLDLDKVTASYYYKKIVLINW